MTDDEKLVHELVFKNNLAGVDQTRQAIIKLDEKAYNMITISGVLMTIIGGVIISNGNTNVLYQVALLIILLPLLACVYYSSKTVKLIPQWIIGISEINKFLCYSDYLQALGDMSLSLEGMQERTINNVIEPKSRNLISSMNCFRFALVLILILSLIKITLLFVYS